MKENMSKLTYPAPPFPLYLTMLPILNGKLKVCMKYTKKFD